MYFFWNPSLAPMTTRHSKVAVLALITKCRVVRFLKLITRLASRIHLPLRLPESAHVIVIRIIGLVPKLLSVTGFLFGSQWRIEFMRVIYSSAFSEAKETPYRP